MSFYNIITAEIRRIYFPNDTNLPYTAYYKLKSLHKAAQSLQFLQKCYEENLNPQFLKISSQNKKQIGLKKFEVTRLRKRKLLSEKNYKLGKLEKLQTEFDQISQKIQNLCYHPDDHSHFIYFLKNLAEKSEKQSDITRNKKLQKLSIDKKLDYNKIEVHNRTNLKIPDDVIDILSLGKNRGIGSDTDLY